MKKEEIKKAYHVFLVCIWVGAQMFGSGMAVVPILQKEFIEKRKWITEDELLDILSICKCTPGAYTVNIVSFIGNKYAGFLGGALSAIGVSIVPIITMIIFTAFYQYIAEIEAVKSAMTGIVICVCSLIANSIITLWEKAIVSKTTLIIFVASLLLYLFTSIHIVVIIIIMGSINLMLEKFIFPKLKNREEKA